MKVTPSPWILLFCAAVLFVANAFFESLHLYFYLLWLDIPMHIASGILIGLIALAAATHEKLLGGKNITTLVVFAVAVSASLVVGLFWEMFASFFGHIAPALGGLEFDTLKDLFDDLLGGLLAAAFFLGKGYNKRI